MNSINMFDLMSELLGVELEWNENGMELEGYAATELTHNHSSKEVVDTTLHA